MTLTLRNKLGDCIINTNLNETERLALEDPTYKDNTIKIVKGSVRSTDGNTVTVGAHSRDYLSFSAREGSHTVGDKVEIFTGPAEWTVYGVRV